MPSMIRFLPLLFLAALLTGRACIAAGGYQLTGRILLKEREYSPRSLPVVLLEGTRTFFAAHTQADLAGRFKFKDLQPTCLR